MNKLQLPEQQFLPSGGLTKTRIKTVNYIGTGFVPVFMLVFFSMFATSVMAESEKVLFSTDDIPNFVEYSESLSSSGQPLKEHMPLLAEMGFDQIIYLALTTNRTALDKEDELVLKNDMNYLHVAVDFSKPSLKNFETVALILQNSKDQKSLLHCQVNYRASTFSFLYRVIYLGVPIGAAKEDLDKVWTPDSVWYQFLVNTLAAHGMTHECDSCDWQERDFD
ncbi:MAG: protein tyrosine phosphatase (PTP) superfamily phosphohydrolase (DUF442 family) [Candidatus Azotimanducaceae bacterium]|jgi:protein tyrosine phosphatase (PTP) superfamily phosphohydrolase (DUF442 family)